MAAKKTAQKPAPSTSVTKTAPKGFTAEEKAAMRQRVKELQGAQDAATWKTEVLEKLAAMAPADRVLGERLHRIITTSAPDLTPKLWYGMPAYYRDGKVVCHFQDAQKFKSRYATLGFGDAARLDEGGVWPVAYAVKTLTAADESRIADLVKKAVRGDAVG